MASTPHKVTQPNNEEAPNPSPQNQTGIHVSDNRRRRFNDIVHQAAEYLDVDAPRLTLPKGFLLPTVFNSSTTAANTTQQQGDEAPSSTGAASCCGPPAAPAAGAQSKTPMASVLGGTLSSMGVTATSFPSYNLQSSPSFSENYPHMRVESVVVAPSSTMMQSRLPTDDDSLLGPAGSADYRAAEVAQETSSQAPLDEALASPDDVRNGSPSLLSLGDTELSLTDPSRLAHENSRRDVFSMLSPAALSCTHDNVDVDGDDGDEKDSSINDVWWNASSAHVCPTGGLQHVDGIDAPLLHLLGTPAASSCHTSSCHTVKVENDTDFAEEAFYDFIPRKRFSIDMAAKRQNIPLRSFSSPHGSLPPRQNTPAAVYSAPDAALPSHVSPTHASNAFPPSENLQQKNKTRTYSKEKKIQQHDGDSGDDEEEPFSSTTGDPIKASAPDLVSASTTMGGSTDAIRAPPPSPNQILSPVLGMKYVDRVLGALRHKSAGCVHYSIRCLLGPVALIVVMLALFTSSITYVALQRTISDITQTQHTYIRIETMLSVESTAFLPMTAAQVTTYLHVSDPPHASPTDVGVPPTAAETTRMMCGALSSSGLSSIPAVMAYSSLDGNAPYSSVCDSGLYSTALAASASSSCDGAGCRDDVPAGDALYEVNRATLSLSEPRRIAGRWPNAMTDGESVLDALGTGSIVREWLNAVHRGDAAAVAQMNYWHISGGETPRLTYTSPFMEANRTKPSHFSCHIDAARLLDKLRRPEFMESAGPSSRVLLIGFSGDATGDSSYAPKMIACSWCDPSSTTTASPSPSLPCCSGGGDSVVHTALQHVDLDEYMRALGDVATGITHGSAAPLLEDASGSVYRSNYTTFTSADGEAFATSISLVTLKSGLSLVLLVVTPSVITAHRYGPYYVCGSIVLLGTCAAVVFVVYLVGSFGMYRPLRVMIARLQGATDTLSPYWSGPSSSLEGNACPVKASQQEKVACRGQQSPVILREINKMMELSGKLQALSEGIQEYFPDGLIVSNEERTRTMSALAQREAAKQAAAAAADGSKGPVIAVVPSVTPHTVLCGCKSLTDALHAGDTNGVDPLGSERERRTCSQCQGQGDEDDVCVIQRSSGHQIGDGRSTVVVLYDHGRRIRKERVRDAIIEIVEEDHTTLDDTPMQSLSCTPPPLHQPAPTAAAASPGVETDSHSTTSTMTTKITVQSTCYTKRFCSVLAIHVPMFPDRAGLQYIPEIMHVVMESAKVYGGSFDLFIPEMLYLSFGSRRQCTDHALRATQCALDIHSKLSEEALQYTTFCVDCGVYYTGICGVPECKGLVLWGRPTGVLFLYQQLLSGFRFLVLDNVVPFIRNHFRLIPVDTIRISEEAAVPQVVLYGIIKGNAQSPSWRSFSTRYNEMFFRILNSNDMQRAMQLLETLEKQRYFPLHAWRLFLLIQRDLIASARGTTSAAEISRQINEMCVTYGNTLMNRKRSAHIFGAREPWYHIMQSDEEDPKSADKLYPDIYSSSIGSESALSEEAVLSSACCPAAGSDDADRSYTDTHSQDTLLHDSIADGARGKSSRANDVASSPTCMVHTPTTAPTTSHRYRFPRVFTDSDGNLWYCSIDAVGYSDDRPIYLGITPRGTMAKLFMYNVDDHNNHDFPVNSGSPDTPKRYYDGHPSVTRLNMQAMKVYASSYYHENIVQFIACAPLPNTPYVCHICEYVPGGTLREAVERFGRPLPLGAIRRYCVSMLRALEYLHKEKNVIHGLLGPDKVLVGVAGSCKITGMSYFYAWADNDPELRARLEKDAACFRSPEVNAGFPKTPASDIYSFGLILLGMLTGSLSPPWTWAGTPMGVPGRSVELDALLANNKLFIEALEEGVIELKQYGLVRNEYNRSLRRHTRKGTEGEVESAVASSAGDGRDWSEEHELHFSAENDTICLETADGDMLKVLEGALAYKPENRKTAYGLLQMLSE